MPMPGTGRDGAPSRWWRRSRSDSGQVGDPVGLEPDFLTDRPHRPTRLSHELEEVDAVRPVHFTAIHRLDRITPGGATHAIRRPRPPQAHARGLHPRRGGQGPRPALRRLRTQGARGLRPGSPRIDRQAGRRGDDQHLGRGRHPAPLRRGDRREQPHADQGHRPGQGEDRQDRRRGPGEPPPMRLPPRGLGAGRRHPAAEAPDRRAVGPGRRPHAAEEPHPRRPRRAAGRPARGRAVHGQGPGLGAGPGVARGRPGHRRPLPEALRRGRRRARVARRPSCGPSPITTTASGS